MPALLYNQNQNAPDDFPRAQTLGVGSLEIIDPTDDLAWALRELATDNEHYQEHRLLRNYSLGKHRIVLDTTEHLAAFNDFLTRLRCNICPAVVDALTDRLRVKGFTGANGEQDALADRAMALWKEHRLAPVANRVHSEMVATGDAFLLVWPDQDGRPRCYPHSALEMCHEHDSERPEIITKAAKVWREGKKLRITLYYPDRIEKHISTQNVDGGTTPKPDMFEPFQVDGEPWPVPNPYGRVPVFHFPYNADCHGHGVGALRDVIPLQDSINHTLIQRAVTIDFAATPMRVMIGVESDIDEQGRPTQPIRSGIDKMMTLANPDAKIAQFDAAALAPFHDAIAQDLNLITVITGIPPHHFQIAGGDFPSGESLKTSETRLVHRIEDTQTDLGGDWARVLAFLLEITDGVSGADLVTEWHSAETRSENDEVNRAATLVERVGVPEETMWERLGFTPEEIEAMTALKEQARATAAAAFGQAFDAGRIE